MDSKQLQKIHERLRIIQVAYSRIFVESVLDAKRFLEILEKNIILNEIPNPSDVIAEPDGTVCIEWMKYTKQGYLDIFSIYTIGDSTLFCEGFIESIGVNLKKTVDLKEDLDDTLLIYVKHFS